MRDIDNEVLKRMVANGLIPSIEEEIQKYKSGADSNVSLYYTAVNIGRYVDTYHNVFQTGNIVECVQPNKGEE
jgi:hypothetical protein